MVVFVVCLTSGLDADHSMPPSNDLSHGVAYSDWSVGKETVFCVETVLCADLGFRQLTL